MIKTKLIGHSGCELYLIEEELINRLYVRKISANKLYNERLIIQCNKQKMFKSDKIKTPRVLRAGYLKDGRFYFDMEYIQGITLAKYLETIDVEKIHSIVDDITDNIITREITFNSDVNVIFRKKILEVKLKLQYNCPILDEALAELERYDWSRFKESNCHGDLTLENLIVKNDKLYAIDFLDSFYNSWLLDVAKLMQDVQTMWSYRNQEKTNANTTIRLLVFRDILLDKIVKTNQALVTDIYFALLLHLIRIYPYTHDKETIEFLNKKVKSILDILKNGEI